MITFCEKVVTSAAPPARITKPLPRASRKQKQILIDSIEWLAGHIKPQTEDESSYLSRIKESLPVLNLYREFFPQDWARSVKSPFGTSKDSAYYSEREVEFFHLVDERVVPLSIDWYLDWEERCPFVPVMSACDWDYYHGAEFTNFTHAFQLAFALNRVDDGSVFSWYCEHRALDTERFVLLGKHDDYTRRQERRRDYPLFKELCKVGDTPLQHLPLAIEITCYDTGNLLFDYSPEMEMPDIFLIDQTFIEWKAEEGRVERLEKELSALSSNRRAS
ncbi:MAG: hypothetical protein MSG64_19115 [Pyrinomonadaceae bacterium MAG19_C2-C3]|nr:hypothetical protein [Pyrinomonadaceae bacterium MAG19_C2-C3]